MSSSETWFRRHRKLTLLAVNIVLLFAADLILGALLIPQAVGVFRRPDSVYHHGLHEKVEAEMSWGAEPYPFITNSLGFRDSTPRDVSLAAEGRRILFMGDSFMEAVGVRHQESVAGLVASALEPEGVEILNAGVIGYSPKIYALKTKHLLETVGLEFDEMVLFIDMSDIPNELVYRNYEGGIGSSEQSRRPVLTWFRMNSFFTRKLADRLGYNPRSPLNFNEDGVPFADNLAQRKESARRKGPWTESYEHASEGFRLATKNVESLLEVCAQHNIEVTLVVYPWPSTIKAGDPEHIQAKHWGAFCANAGVRFVNLFPTFFELESPAEYFIDGDMHWNANGHKLVADQILPLLQ